MYFLCLCHRKGTRYRKSATLRSPSSILKRRHPRSRPLFQSPPYSIVIDSPTERPHVLRTELLRVFIHLLRSTTPSFDTLFILSSYLVDCLPNTGFLPRKKGVERSWVCLERECTWWSAQGLRWDTPIIILDVKHLLLDLCVSLLPVTTWDWL